MFLHQLKYDLLSGFRTKDVLFWLIIFPIALGTMFKIAFSGIYEKTTKFSAIPAAIVMEEENSAFRQTVQSVSDGGAFLKASFVSEDEALKLLSDGKVKGIIYCGDELSLTVDDDGYEQTILQAFLDSYTVRESVIIDAFKDSPEKAQDVIAALSDDAASCVEIPLTKGNTDNYVQYFYNLIAMVAMYGSITGLHITVQNQADMSELGARVSCSPTSKQKRLLSTLFASFVLQAFCMVICVTFLSFILHIELGSHLPLIYLASILGGCLGVAVGFFIGSFGRLSTGVKVGIAMGVSMICCFFSGLMVGNIKAAIVKVAPWVNNVNPPAVISDSIYCLNIYSDYDRFTVKIVTMLAMTALFTVLGLFLSRRKNYASL